MKLLWYDIEFRFLKGEKLVIADTLSRAYVADPGENRDRIMKVKVDLSDSRLCEIRDATLNDSNLQILANTISNGWPDTKDDVADCCEPYFNMRDVYSVSTRGL